MKKRQCKKENGIFQAGKLAQFEEGRSCNMKETY